LTTELGLDLTKAPYDADPARWTNPTDYSHCHAVADESRSLGATAILSSSARDPASGPIEPHCAGLDPCDDTPARVAPAFCRIAGLDLAAQRQQPAGGTVDADRVVGSDDEGVCVQRPVTGTKHLDRLHLS
jgi:hypothetical protein